jgi:hypothetical protein
LVATTRNAGPSGCHSTTFGNRVNSDSGLDRPLSKHSGHCSPLALNVSLAIDPLQTFGNGQSRRSHDEFGGAVALTSVKGLIPNLDK